MSGGVVCLACAAVLAAAAGWAQKVDEVTVTSDAESRETTYTVVSGSCRISWIVSGFEINRGGVRQRSQCSLPLPEQIALISRVMGRVLEDSSSAGAPRTFYWGRLYPDGQPDSTLAVRLALAAKRSRLWDVSRGRARGENENNLVRKLLNDAPLYAELREMFRARGLEIQVSGVEKVLVARAGRLPFFSQFPKGEMKATDRVPYDCMTWFSITKVRP